MTIRTATLADLPALVAVEAACFPVAEAATEAELRDRLTHYADHFWLLLDGDRLVSFVDGMVTDQADLTDDLYADAAKHDEHGAWQMIFGVNTLPADRRHGYAAALLHRAIADARAQGRKGLVLTCKDALVPYYAGFGFINEGTSVSTHGSVRWNQMRLTFHIRKACAADIPAVAQIYDRIHAQEQQGLAVIGWQPGVYPVAATAQGAFERGELFVYEDAGRILAAAIINQQQVDAYARGHWQDDAPAAEVMVLHTLVVDPGASGRGLGKAFVRFYEEYARAHGCAYLRMDTNARNAAARRLYVRMGYHEADIVPCDFNGIPGIQLVLLEKRLTIIPEAIHEKA